MNTLKPVLTFVLGFFLFGIMGALPSAMVSFTAGTTILSADVNSNFTSLFTPLNGQINAANLLDGGISPEDMSQSKTFTLDAATITTTFTIPASAGAASTTAGVIKVNTTNSTLSVGTGAAAKTVATLGSNQTFTGTNQFDAQAVFSAGTIGAPGITFASDLDTGVASPAGNTMQFSVGAVGALGVNTSNITASLPFLEASGSVAAPAWSFVGDTDTGLYRIGNNNFALAVNGTKILDVTASSISPTVPIAAPAASTGAPAYAFAADLTTGMWASGGQLILDAGGSDLFFLDGTACTIAKPIRGTDGSAAAPQFSFSAAGNTDNGMYRIGTDVIGFSTAGVERVRVDSSGLTVTGDLWKMGGSAYTNPDYVFEKAYTGVIKLFAGNPGAESYKLRTVDEYEKTARETYRLPGIGNEAASAFKRSDIVLEKLEDAFRFIFEQNKRIKALEAALGIQERRRGRKRSAAADTVRGL